MGPQWLLLCFALIASAYSQSPASLTTPSAASDYSQSPASLTTQSAASAYSQSPASLTTQSAASAYSQSPASLTTQSAASAGLTNPFPTASKPLQANVSPQSTPETVMAATVLPSTSATGAGLASNFALLNSLVTLFSPLSSQASSQGNNSQSVNALIGQLPGLVQGLGGVDLQGNNVTQLLASLFSNPNAAGIPAWIEALMAPGNNSSQSLQDAQTLLQSFSQQDPDSQFQTLLAKVFTDVTRGLQSLNVTANSTSQDVISAILNDPGLMSSLSSDALQMMGVMGVPELLQQQFPVEPDSQCGADLSAFGSGLQQGDMWSLQMLDATGKLQAGLLTGMMTLFGDYDECLDISHVNGSHTIQGQFCSVTMAIPEFMGSLAPAPNTNLILHVCLPKSCTSQKQIYFLLQPTIEALQSKFKGAYCHPRPDPTGDSVFTGTIVTLGVLILLCAAGTAYGAVLDCIQDRHNTSSGKDTSENRTNNVHVNNAYIKEDADHVNGGVANGYKNNKEIEAVEAGGLNGQTSAGGVATTNGTAVVEVRQPPAKESLPSHLLLSFSVLRNGRKVLNCDKNSADISCLHGIRVLSITWVVIGHCFSYFATVEANQTGRGEMLEKFTYAAIVSGVLAVDTFFVLSGFLTAFLFLRTTKKTGLTVSGVILYYIHRVWRLTPLYGLVLLVYIGAAPYMMEGPYQHTQILDNTICRDYWYLNLLYVNNLFGTDKLCFGWSWYLSNDMQFSFLAPLVLIPWYFGGRIKIIGFLLTAAMIVTHCISTGVLMSSRNLNLYNGKVLEYLSGVYYKPWCRIGAYAVGLILGYILHVTRGKYTMTKMSWILGWTMATAVGLTLVYLPYDNIGHMLTKGPQWTTDDNAGFEALSRVLWAVCVSWVVFACTTGYGGFVNTLMSWSAWAPLSRLTYGVYLVHLAIIYVLAGNVKKPLYQDSWTLIEMNIAVTVLSFLISFVFSMLVEAPTLGLEKAVLGRIFGKRK